jgi:hypothetical protein
MRFLQQDTLTEAVKGRNFQPLRGFPIHQPDNPLSHFPCRLVGKGHGADMPGGIALFDQPGNFTRDDAGFSATGTRQYQAWPVNTFDRLLLRPVEILQVQGR